jgi:predicted Zn finger-like uncharacterized protein
MITRCPACETAFRITEAQLNTARGAVRCGSCLQIFKAVDNLVSRSEGQKPVDTGTDKTAAVNRAIPQAEELEETLAAPAPQGNQLHFDQAAIDAADDASEDGIFADDRLIDDQMPLDDENETSQSGDIDGEGESEHFLDLDAWKPMERSLFDREIKTPKYPDDDDERKDPDESWALDLLKDDEIKPDSAPEPGLKQKPHPTFNSFSALDDSDSDTDTGQDFGEAMTADATDSRGSYPSGGSFPSDDSYLDTRYQDGGAPDDHDRHVLLSRIEPEPVEFAVYQGRNWRKTLLWSGLAVLGILLLLGQLAWLQLDKWGRQQPYRNLYAAVCPLLTCELPSLTAPHLIRSSNLVVRSHPKAEGALVVDTILLNTAPFQQAFPDLILSFGNVHGETLAARRFTSREYLAGELAGRTAMPSNQPIHLSLEIVDPGPDAVNYSAYIPH